MNDDQIVAKSMFGIVLLLVITGIAICSGEILASLPIVIRWILGIAAIAGGLALGCRYLRRI